MAELPSQRSIPANDNLHIQDNIFFPDLQNNPTREYQNHWTDYWSAGPDGVCDTEPQSISPPANSNRNWDQEDIDNNDAVSDPNEFPIIPNSKEKVQDIKIVGAGARIYQ